MVLNSTVMFLWILLGHHISHAYDDDGEHYYSGWLIGECWEVIYEWAAAYAGATEIKDGQHKGIIG